MGHYREVLWGSEERLVERGFKRTKHPAILAPATASPDPHPTSVASTRQPPAVNQCFAAEPDGTSWNEEGTRSQHESLHQSPKKLLAIQVCSQARYPC